MSYYYCDDCDRYFDNYRALGQHLENSRAHCSTIYECETCDREFAHQRHANQHMDAVNHWAPRYECDTCTLDFISIQAVKNHMDSHEHWAHYCHPCSRKFDSDNNLQMHLNSRVHRGSHVPCPFCNRTFVTASGLSAHLENGGCKSAPLDRQAVHRMVSGRDPGQLVTRKQLEYNATYEATDRAWNGEGYECYLCHQEYSSLGALNRHVTGRHAAKLYHCPKASCGREFVSLAAMFNHLESECCGYVKFETVNKGVQRFFSSGRLIGF